MPFHDLSLTLTDAPCDADREFIDQQIKDHNDRVSPHHRAIRPIGPRPLAILVRDASDQLVGGLVGATYWGWLEIDDLWLDEAWRRRGLGRQLMAMAETEATKRGCSRAMLRTFSFQARGFYQACGYRVVGELNAYPPGECFYWMRKDL